MSDSEPITVSEKNLPSDLNPVFGEFLSSIPYKFLFYIYIIYLLLSNDVFYTRILGKLDGAVESHGSPSTYGTIITGVLLVLFVTVIDVLIKKHII
jgi:hypothetical protein